MSGVLSAEEVWNAVAALRPGSRAEFKYRLQGGRSWRDDCGKVVASADLTKEGASRYASVVLDSDPSRAVMLPQDGNHGTLKIEYRLIAEEEVIPPMAASPPSVVVPEVVDACPPRVYVPAVSMTVPNAPAHGGDLSYLTELLKTSAPAVVEPFTMRQYLDPGCWDQICARGDLEVYKASAWLTHFFEGIPISSIAAEKLIFHDLVLSLCGDLEVVRSFPALCRNATWVTARKTLISRLVLQLARRDGATALQLEAMAQGFQDEHRPDWIQTAAESARNHLRLITPPTAAATAKAPAKQKGKASH